MFASCMLLDKIYYIAKIYKSSTTDIIMCNDQNNGLLITSHITGFSSYVILLQEIPINDSICLSSDKCDMKNYRSFLCDVILTSKVTFLPSLVSIGPIVCDKKRLNCKKIMHVNNRGKMHIKHQQFSTL
jgi:hypothetical protein